jgi:hypothetical protein
MDKDKTIPTKVTAKAKNIFRHVEEMDHISKIFFKFRKHLKLISNSKKLDYR